MESNACPCMPLQKGVKIMAIIDIVWSVILIIVYIAAVSAVDASEEVKVGAFVVLLIIGILDLLLAITLYRGAVNRNIKHCRIWRLVFTILLIINITSTILSSLQGVDAQNIVVPVLSWVYRLYMIWTVHCFITELKLDQGLFGPPTLPHVDGV